MTMSSLGHTVANRANSEHRSDLNLGLHILKKEVFGGVSDFQNLGLTSKTLD